MITDKNLKIFFVDDDPFCLYMYEKHIQNLGYKNIKTFDSGAACFESLSEKPDVIFLDQSMNNITGLEMLQTIKRLIPEIQIIFISGQENVETVIKAYQMGAFEYIFKGEYELEGIEKVLSKISASRETLKAKNKSALISRMLSFMF